MSARAIVVILALVSSFLAGCRSEDAASGSTLTTGPDPDFAGCQAECGTNEAFDDTDVVAQPGAQVGDLVRCPVSGAVFRVDQERPLVEHDGRTYYVCCPGCAQRFAQEPSRFATPS